MALIEGSSLKALGVKQTDFSQYFQTDEDCAVAPGTVKAMPEIADAWAEAHDLKDPASQRLAQAGIGLVIAAFGGLSTRWDSTRDRLAVPLLDDESNVNLVAGMSGVYDTSDRARFLDGVILLDAAQAVAGFVDGAKVRRGSSGGMDAVEYWRSRTGSDGGDWETIGQTLPELPDVSRLSVASMTPREPGMPSGVTLGATRSRSRRAMFSTVSVLDVTKPYEKAIPEISIGIEGSTRNTSINSAEPTMRTGQIGRLHRMATALRQVTPN